MFFQTLSRADIMNNLIKLDTELTEPTTIVIVGGSALSLQIDFARGTQDIDYLGDVKLDKTLLNELQLSNDVENIYNVPDLSEADYDMVYEFRNLKVYVMSMDDLAITKFYTTRDKDLNDLKEYILPNVKSLSRLRRRLDYYRPDYPFNINDMNLNLNSFDEVVAEVLEREGSVWVDERKTLEEALREYKVYDKFVNDTNSEAKIGVSVEMALRHPMSVCLDTLGFSDYLTKVTGIKFRK